MAFQSGNGNREQPVKADSKDNLNETPRGATAPGRSGAPVTEATEPTGKDSTKDSSSQSDKHTQPTKTDAPTTKESR